MSDTYGHRWTAHMGDKPNKVWAKRLAGLTMEQIQRGIDKDFERGDDWPPSAPRFVELCLGSYEDFGMLQPEAAYQAAAKRQYLATGVYHTLTSMGGTHEFQRMTADKAKPTFMKQYRAALERLRQGFPLREMPQAPPGAKQLEERGEPTPEEVERGRQALAELRKKLGMGPSPTAEEEQTDGS